MPAFLADTMWTNQSTGTNTLYEDKEGKPTRLAENSVYALWIGTNDLGVGAFLTDSQRRTNATVARDFTDCVWGVFDALYGAGGRHFGERCIFLDSVSLIPLARGIFSRSENLSLYRVYGIMKAPE